MQQLTENENDYAKLQLRHLQPLRKQLEQEIAEESWRQALMTAAQLPQTDADSPEGPYGRYVYRREPVPGSLSRLRHLRIRAPAAPPGTTESLAQAPRPASPSSQIPAGPPLLATTGAGPERELTAGGTTGSEDAGPPWAAIIVLDEQLRAAASASPAAYTLHSLAPSPCFGAVAFTEACEPVPEGERRPDRFELRVVDAATGEPLLPPLSGVSGDVGWVTAPPGPAICTGGGEDDGGSSECYAGRAGGDGRARLYFVRAAQRELWSWDVRLPGPQLQLPLPGPTVPARTASPAAAPSAAARLAEEGYGRDADRVRDGGQPGLQTTPGASSAGGNDGEGTDAGALGAPRLVLRDPDGQPIQLVRRGRNLYAEVLGNDEVPLEVRLLGTARGCAPRAAGEATLCPAAAGARSSSGNTVHHDGGGVPLLPRESGRSYSVHHVEMAPEPADDPEYRPGSEGGCVGGSVHSGTPEAPDAVLLWLRDLDHNNGCVLVTLLDGPRHDGAPGTAAAAVSPTAAVVGGATAQGTAVGGPPQQLLPPLELVPHDPGLRVLHLEARGPGRLLLVRVAVDARGDPGDTLQLEELRLAWRGPHPPAALASHRHQPPLAAAQGPGGSGGSSHSSSTGSDAGRRCGPLVMTVVRRRTVMMPGGRCSVLRVVDWDADGAQVAVSCSSMACAPATARAVELRQDRADALLVLERLWATSHDGTEVPITLCRLREAAGAVDERSSQPRPVPLLLRVYGAYGTDPPIDWQPSLLPLLRRGVVVAVAHVRGGDRLGPRWYEGGRGLRKANSHLDLLAAAGELVRRGVTAPELMCLEAESAGGWAAGPALNAAGSSLFRAALLTVPTLDAATSLLEDPTYGPYELGDAFADAVLYRSVVDWSPYDGLRAEQPYPALLLRVGLYDTNVPYWDPAKYMARLRTLAGGGAVSSALRVMQVRPAGHDAYDNLGDEALRCAFVLWTLGAWRQRSELTGGAAGGFVGRAR
ncbi:hypothetical protein GPECTOR_39g453 [Gonium pectorale]|uniref:Prolyl endopeptidase-like n=1 Tax=Gonium pectorale TaxID=33097 RepID=A0A150GAV1_GONPE|nr:hypothetical protein GPECTOR_39g453 [Gonium pectorale]|eukprot:KXZ46959.1 hypothetical protein GPECTOR_39g453 [Gonium pectorale]